MRRPIATDMAESGPHRHLRVEVRRFSLSLNVLASAIQAPSCFKPPSLSILAPRNSYYLCSIALVTPFLDVQQTAGAQLLAPASRTISCVGLHLA